MPVLIQNNLPVIEKLQNEGLFVMKNSRAHRQKIRPLQIILVNLMPSKEATELQFLRLLSNSPLQIEISLLRMDTHHSKTTDENYLKKFYTTLKKIKNRRFDGMIITGAPVETLKFEDVDYWNELCELMEYSKNNVFSTMYICWGAQAGLYYHHHINKYTLPHKKFGLFVNTISQKNNLLFKGMNNQVFVPHSRHTSWRVKEIMANPELKIGLFSKEAGPSVITAYNNRQIFISGHFEYDIDTLAGEYFRDLKKGLDISIPKHYFKDNNPQKEVIFNWSSDANLLFTNWLNYVIYQDTPYDLNKLTSIERDKNDK